MKLSLYSLLEASHIQRKDGLSGCYLMYRQQLVIDPQTSSSASLGTLSFPWIRWSLTVTWSSFAFNEGGHSTWPTWPLVASIIKALVNEFTTRYFHVKELCKWDKMMTDSSNQTDPWPKTSNSRGMLRVKSQKERSKCSGARIRVKVGFPPADNSWVQVYEIEPMVWGRVVPDPRPLGSWGCKYWSYNFRIWWNYFRKGFGYGPQNTMDYHEIGKRLM